MLERQILYTLDSDERVVARIDCEPGGVVSIGSSERAVYANHVLYVIVRERRGLLRRLFHV